METARGRSAGGFKTTPVPETTAGDGEAAYPVDYTRGGLTSFLVLNGQVPYSGPIQLLTPQAPTSGTQPGPATFHRGAASGARKNRALAQPPETSGTGNSPGPVKSK